MSPTANTWLCSFLSSPPGSHLLGVSATLHWPLLELCALSFGQSLDRDSFLCFLLSRAKAVQNFHKSFRKGQLKPKKRRNLKYMQRLWHISYSFLVLYVLVCTQELQNRSYFTPYLRCFQISSVIQSCHSLFVTPWTAARQASLSITGFQSSLKLMSIESVMPSKHLLLCFPYSCPQTFPASGLVKWVSSSHQVAKILEFQFQNQSFEGTPTTDLL